MRQSLSTWEYLADKFQMCIGRGGADERRPPAAQTPAGRNHQVQAALNLVMVRAASILAPPTAVVIGIIAAVERDIAYVGLAGLAALVGGSAIWQLAVNRPRALLLNLLSGAGFGLVAPFTPHEVAVGLGTGIVVLTMAGIPLLSSRRVLLYVAAMTLPWASQLSVKQLALGFWSEGVVVTLVVQVVFLVYGIAIMIHMQRQLNRSEGRYAYLFRHAPVSLWENDFSRVEAWLEGLREGGVEELRAHLTANPEELRHGIGLVTTTDVNHAAAALLAADDPSDLLGSFPTEVLDAEAEQLFLEQFVSVWERTSGDDQEYAGRRLDGSHFHGVLRWSNPVLVGGDLSRVVTAVSDVTDLREIEEELENSETRSRALLEAMPDLLFLCAADGTFLDYHVAEAAQAAHNRSSFADLYIAPSAFLGKRPAEVLPPQLAEEMLTAVTMALETSHLQTLEYELPIAGHERYWEMRVAPLKGRSEVLALARDITDQVQARRELENLVRSKDDFIAAISHELRTPLTGIIGFGHLLRGDTDSMAPDERRQMIETMVEQAADLSNIVDDLLVVAMTDLGRLEVARVPTNLRAQAAQVLESADSQAVRHVELRGSDVNCIGDPARVRQVMRNLLTNAQRYGGDRVRIELSRGLTAGQVTVVDNGSGVPVEEVEQVFLPYHRAAPTKGLTAALGMGLYISRTLARLMHGDLTYEYVDGETRFELTLPLVEPETPGMAMLSSAASNGSGSRLARMAGHGGSPTSEQPERTRQGT